jgi:hypothetical protein
MSADPTTKPAPMIGRWGRLAYAVVLVAVTVLAFTGIGTFVAGYAPMTHWVLMAHVAFAPLFAIGLAVMALTWTAPSRQRPLARALLWLMLACGLLVILSGVVPMLPIFGTDGLHLLYLTHRYAGIVLAATVAAHLIVKK